MKKHPGFLLLASLVFSPLVLVGSKTAHAMGRSPTDHLIPIQEVFTPVETYDPVEYGKVAILQWNPPGSTPLGVSRKVAEAYKQKNREALAAFMREAAANGAQLVVTSEMVVDGYPDDDYQTRKDLEPYVETIPGPSTRYFAQLARELGIWIHIGLAENDPTTDEFHNAMVVLSPEGQLVAHYRKHNLFEEEVDYFAPGTTPVTYESQFGKIGVLICADVYDHFTVPAYAKANVNALALGASWVQYNDAMEYFSTAARSAHAYFLGANQMYAPDSGIINPDGSDQSHIRQSAGLAYGYLPYVWGTSH